MEGLKKRLVKRETVVRPTTNDNTDEQSSLAVAAASDAVGTREDRTFLEAARSIISNAEPGLTEPNLVPAHVVCENLTRAQTEREQEVAKLEENFQRVSSLLGEYVNDNYDSFNSTVDYFTQMICKITVAQDSLAEVKGRIDTASKMMRPRTVQLKVLRNRAARNAVVRRLASSVKACLQAEGDVTDLVRRGRWTQLVARLAEVKNSLDLERHRGIRALAPVANTIAGISADLPKLLTSEIIGEIFSPKRTGESASNIIGGEKITSLHALGCLQELRGTLHNTVTDLAFAWISNTCQEIAAQHQRALFDRSISAGAAGMLACPDPASAIVLDNVALLDSDVDVGDGLGGTPISISLQQADLKQVLNLLFFGEPSIAAVLESQSKTNSLGGLFGVVQRLLWVVVAAMNTECPLVGQILRKSSNAKLENPFSWPWANLKVSQKDWSTVMFPNAGAVAAEKVSNRGIDSRTSLQRLVEEIGQRTSQGSTTFWLRGGTQRAEPKKKSTPSPDLSSMTFTFEQVSAIVRHCAAGLFKFNQAAQKEASTEACEIFLQSVYSQFQAWVADCVEKVVVRWNPMALVDKIHGTVTNLMRELADVHDFQGSVSTAMQSLKGTPGSPLATTSPNGGMAPVVAGTSVAVRENETLGLILSEKGRRISELSYTVPKLFDGFGAVSAMSLSSSGAALCRDRVVNEPNAQQVQQQQNPAAIALKPITFFVTPSILNLGAIIIAVDQFCKLSLLESPVVCAPPLPEPLPRKNLSIKFPLQQFLLSASVNHLVPYVKDAAEEHLTAALAQLSQNSHEAVGQASPGSPIVTLPTTIPIGTPLPVLLACVGVQRALQQLSIPARLVSPEEAQETVPPSATHVFQPIVDATLIAMGELIVKLGILLKKEMESLAVGSFAIAIIGPLFNDVFNLLPNVKWYEIVGGSGECRYIDRLIAAEYQRCSDQQSAKSFKSDDAELQRILGTTASTFPLASQVVVAGIACIGRSAEWLSERYLLYTTATGQCWGNPCIPGSEFDGVGVPLPVATAYKQITQISQACLFMISLDLKKLVITNMINLRDASYNLTVCRKHPTAFVEDFSHTLGEYFGVLRRHYSPQQRKYLALSVARPIGELFIAEISHLRDKRVTGAGIEQLCTDLISIYRRLISLVPAPDLPEKVAELFSKAWKYITLLGDRSIGSDLLGLRLDREYTQLELENLVSLIFRSHHVDTGLNEVSKLQKRLQVLKTLDESPQKLDLPSKEVLLKRFQQFRDQLQSTAVKPNSEKKLQEAAQAALVQKAAEAAAPKNLVPVSSVSRPPLPTTSEPKKQPEPTIFTKRQDPLPRVSFDSLPSSRPSTTAPTPPEKKQTLATETKTMTKSADIVVAKTQHEDEDLEEEEIEEEEEVEEEEEEEES